MALPFEPPIEPMLAKAADSLPSGDGWLFEPKWDGFRALVFRDGHEVYTQSRDLKPLDRYFPELAEPLRAALPERCVLDGEVVIARDGALDFEALLLRIHPAASRVAMLAEASPASFVAWDLLALGDEDLRQTPQSERRARLEQQCDQEGAAHDRHGEHELEGGLGHELHDHERPVDGGNQRAALERHLQSRRVGHGQTLQYSIGPQPRACARGTPLCRRARSGTRSLYPRNT
jgi:hypothetical protein